MTPVSYYVGITGIIERIFPMQEQCCNQILSLRTPNGSIRFILSPGTYVTDNIQMRPGMRVTAFYDSNMPVPLIYPPQYQASFISRIEPGETVVVTYFDDNLVSTDNPLKLNVDTATRVTTANGQPYTCGLPNRLLMVYYSAATRSIPPQTTPDRIIVFC